MSFTKTTHLTFNSVLLSLSFAAQNNGHFVPLTLENQVPPEHMRFVAAQLNESKATFLHNLRTQLLQKVAFTQEEDVDVERVVKTAVDVFDHEKQEILLKIINENK